MKNNDYIVIQAPMVSELGLSGNRLIIYALIHSFSKDGSHEFMGSISYIEEWTNLTRNTVISILKSLIDDGLVVKREYTSNNVKFCAYSIGGSAKIAPLVQKLHHQEEIFDGGGSAKIAPNNYNKRSTIIEENKKYNNNNIVSPSETNVIFDESEEQFIDRIYDLYPTKCPKRNTRLGKSSQDKKRIKRLMGTYSREDIERVVKAEIDEKYGKTYMLNFSTFLNNFPDPKQFVGNESNNGGIQYEEDLIRYYYDTLSYEEQAKILQLDPYQYRMLSDKGKEYWRNVRRQLMVDWIKAQG